MMTGELAIAYVDYSRAFRRGDVERIDDALSRIETIRARESSADTGQGGWISTVASRPKAKPKRGRKCVFVRHGRKLMRVA